MYDIFVSLLTCSLKMRLLFPVCVQTRDELRLKVMGEELSPTEVSKRRITTQLKDAVKALQAAHVKNRSKVVHRYDSHIK